MGGFCFGCRQEDALGAAGHDLIFFAGDEGGDFFRSRCGEGGVGGQKVWIDDDLDP